jgi:serine acetyltransferase
MKKNIFRRVFNRFLHVLARTLPGSESLRPALHRLRGVKIGRGVFIGDDVYLENEYPEAVELEDGAQVSLRVVFIAHTRGTGKIILGKNAYIGAGAMLITTSGRTLKIGEGAVIGAGVVVGSDVAPQMFVPSHPAKAAALATVLLPTAETMEDFIRGLKPLKRTLPPAGPSRPETADPDEIKP